jgi:hypothetical protein
MPGTLVILSQLIEQTGVGKRTETIVYTMASFPRPSSLSLINYKFL